MAGAPVRCGVLVISDRCYRKEVLDESGPCLVDLLRTSKHITAAVDIVSCVPDEVDMIQATLKNWADVLGTELIITSGGTGFGIRDCTPEATSAILDRVAHGMMAGIAQQTFPHSILSRGVAGTRKTTLIINFPGSPKACKECFVIVESKIPHIIDLIRNNLVVVSKAHHERPTNQSANQPTNQSLNQSLNQPLNQPINQSANQPIGQSVNQQAAPPVASSAKGVAFRNRKSPFPIIPVPEAQAMVWQQAEILGTEVIHLQDGLGRILAENVVAKDPLPPFRASIKDGYAVLSADGDGVRNVVGQSHAGGGAGGVGGTGGGLVRGTCVRITTGAPLPEEADAVVQVEDTELVSHDANGEEVSIRITKAPQKGQDIRNIGSDIPPGVTIAPLGARIDPGCLGVLATCGTASLHVYKQPIVGLLSTGDELVTPDTHPLPQGKIRDSNKTLLLHTVRKAGFTVLDFGIAKDNLTDLTSSFFKAASKTDVVVLTGGVSMGEKDLVKTLICQTFKGVIYFGRVFMKPGLPTTFGVVTIKKNNITKNTNHKNNKNSNSNSNDSNDSNDSNNSNDSNEEVPDKKVLVFGLPGNPVSAAVTCNLFVLPALRKISGDPNFLYNLVRAETLGEVKLDSRPEFHRALLNWNSGKAWPVVESTGNQISSRLLSFSGADVLLCMPPKGEGPAVLPAGSIVDTILL